MDVLKARTCWKKMDSLFNLAEGGTEYDHAVSIARSKDIMDYTYHPDNPILSARQSSTIFTKDRPCRFCTKPSGDWYMVFLASRPLSERGRCILGRETAIEQLQWKGDGLMSQDQGKREKQLK